MTRANVRDESDDTLEKKEEKGTGFFERTNKKKLLERVVFLIWEITKRVLEEGRRYLVVSLSVGLVL